MEPQATRTAKAGTRTIAQLETRNGGGCERDGMGQRGAALGAAVGAVSGGCVRCQLAATE